MVMKRRLGKYRMVNHTGNAAYIAMLILIAYMRGTSKTDLCTNPLTPQTKTVANIVDISILPDSSMAGVERSHHQDHIMEIGTRVKKLAQAHSVMDARHTLVE